MTRFRRVHDAVWPVAGMAFAALWCASVLLFPLYKRQPAGFAPVVLGVLLALPLLRASVRAALNDWLARLSTGTFLAAAVVLALVLRLAAVLVTPAEPYSDHLHYHVAANNLIDGKGYGPTSFYPPGMSYLLAAWYALVGPDPRLGKLLNVLLGTALVPLAFDMARRTLSLPAARWAALLTAIMPTLVLYSATLGYETPLSLILLAVCDLALRARTPDRGGLAALVGCGLLLGIGSLFKPICLLVPGLLLIGWLAWGLRWRAALGTVIVVGCMACVIAPWTLRNLRVLGAPVLISTNGGVVLYSANNPESDGIYSVPAPVAGETGDEVTRDRLRGQAAKRWIVEHPGTWASFALKRTVYLWGTSSSMMAFVSGDRMSPALENAYKALINVFWTMLAVLFVSGLRPTGAWRNQLLGPALLLVLYVTGLHLFFESLSRHHIPVLAGLVLVVSATLAREARSVPPRPRNDEFKMDEERRARATECDLCASGSANRPR